MFVQGILHPMKVISLSKRSPPPFPVSSERCKKLHHNLLFRPFHALFNQSSSLVEGAVFPLDNKLW
jgi:hypothetical protein